MNVKYVFSYISIKDADLTPVFSSPIGRCNIPIYIYELQGYWPRYYLGDIKHALIPTFSDSTIELNVDAGTSSKTLFMENAYLPRWKATIDGIATPIQVANGIYMSIVVPSGKHHVIFKYH